MLHQGWHIVLSGNGAAIFVHHAADQQGHHPLERMLGQRLAGHLVEVGDLVFQQLVDRHFAHDDFSIIPQFGNLDTLMTERHFLEQRGRRQEPFFSWLPLCTYPTLPHLVLPFCLHGTTKSMVLSPWVSLRQITQQHHLRIPLSHCRARCVER